ncbi:hypothetical protein CP985_04170 [Malaciobacter mytili LMG 24559]|uniref:HNH endonuclease n=1 Tax=Malaciobacter mytili LMG 24559 TaxID=1032238 RepID=A0AAX2AH79_9BACT|nr:HNH endonuclease signature motif containing protein [Malaciobacter mytili]AXH13750.1 putative endonuclease [Malaciobacter mytili LMG 24559]RXK16359.1 hypothetical protein CP985_04170 [Malaciobacter mytili LMG 24559]
MAKEKRETRGRISGFKFLDLPYENAQVHYTCLSCQKDNYVDIGKELLSVEDAYQNANWVCKSCGFNHSSKSDLPFEHWNPDIIKATSLPTQRFWNAFFKNSLESAESYYKICGACGRTLPFSHFAKKSSSKGPLVRQFECRACKAAANAILNPFRTRDEMLKSATSRRTAQLFTDVLDEKIEIKKLFEKFDSKCFSCECDLDIDDRKSYQIDHILPNVYLWPLTESNAELLCRGCNLKKKHHWPSKFFKSNSKLYRLAQITGANLELLTSTKPLTNTDVDVNLAMDKYLGQIREQSDFPKRIQEFKKIIEGFDLIDKLSLENKQILGLEE